MDGFRIPVGEWADAAVDWSLPAPVVDRRVRGVTPVPDRAQPSRSAKP